VDLEQAIRNHQLINPWRFRVVGPESLAHLGPARQEKEPPGRKPPGDYVTFLP
jgi:hypothetical protein